MMQNSSKKKPGFAFGPEPMPRMKKNIDVAVEMGAELITCDNPDEVLEILRKKNLHK